MSSLTRLDKVRRALFRGAWAAALVAAIAFPAHGGGPLELVNHVPVVYPNGGTSLTLRIDQGTLGTRTNAQATLLVQNAIGLWNGVNTSTMRLALGTPLPTDYTLSNYNNVFDNFTDGINPVIFDTNGSITDAIFGVGAKSNVLGFAGSAYYTSGPSAGKYAEGQAVLNGYINISDATWTVVLAHEFGHFFGLDHSQLDATQGLASSNFVLMYPIAYRTLQTLHEDDVAAVTALYPAGNVNSMYGQLTGTFTTALGTPIRGANIWVKETATGKVYSVVSDFLTQGTGYFRLYLPPGTYTLSAESIASSFTGGSGVGPYSSNSTDVSFQSPHPITPVTLGGGSPLQIPIVAGCIAITTFRLDGAGIVQGNCGSTPSPTTTTLTSSGSPASAGSNVTFTATVAGAAPTGTVNFTDGGTTIAGCGAVALSGAGNSRTATCSTSSLAAGVHIIGAAYSGNAGNLPSISTPPLSQMINAILGTNVALASAGAVATASSAYSASSFPVAAINNNERAGVNWGSGGGWADGTASAFPDWVQINFNGSKTIDRVVVYTVQDNFANPVEPTDTTTFSSWGVTDFTVQGWNGSAWVTLGSVSGNNLVKRTVTFSAFTTDRIRVTVNNALGSYSRIVEIEAFGVAATNAQSNVALASAGAVATASSAYSASSFPVAAINNNERAGVNWGSGGGWADGTASAFPDWVQINFNGSKTIDRVVVYTVQDNFANPVEPTDTTTFSSWGVTDFTVQGWNGSAWVTLGSVSGNNLVKRTVTFSAFTTDRIRVTVNNALGSYSRIVEIEAFGVAATTTQSNVALASAGAVASGSSAYSASSFPVAAINNNERAGVNWGSGGGWADGSAGAFPDWVQIDFTGSKTIDSVVVYTVQDNFANPVEPTDTMTFGAWGATGFTVQTWNGSAWVTQGTVTGNNLVKRTVSFSAVTTDRIRINVNSSADGLWSRITEVEAWGQ